MMLSARSSAWTWLRGCLDFGRLESHACAKNAQGWGTRRRGTTGELSHSSQRPA